MRATALAAALAALLDRPRDGARRADAERSRAVAQTGAGRHSAVELDPERLRCRACRTRRPFRSTPPPTAQPSGHGRPGDLRRPACLGMRRHAEFRCQRTSRAAIGSRVVIDGVGELAARPRRPPARPDAAEPVVGPPHARGRDGGGRLDPVGLPRGDRPGAAGRRRGERRARGRGGRGVGAVRAAAGAGRRPQGGPDEPRRAPRRAPPGARPHARPGRQRGRAGARGRSSPTTRRRSSRTSTSPARRRGRRGSPRSPTRRSTPAPVPASRAPPPPRVGPAGSGEDWTAPVASGPGTGRGAAAERPGSTPSPSG